MTASRKGAAFFTEFRDFVAFLGTLWGLLATVSVFFPLSDAFFEVIPLQAYEDDGVFDHLSPPFITTVSTVITLFVVLSTFGRRDEYQGTGREAARRQAWRSLGLSLVALLTYMIVHQIYAEYGHAVSALGSDDPRKLFFEVPLFLAYAACFALLTRAFMLLGMAEYYREP